MTDSQLLSQYLQGGHDDAFAELVHRHVHWVNAMAARLVHDANLADDVTQAVFTLLAQKAKSLRKETVLSTWLFTVTRYCASSTLRNEIRRRIHERRAAGMRHDITSTSEVPSWEELAPVLDELVERLPRSDRKAVLLRFYEQKSFSEIGKALEISEEAARKRVSRAIELLRGLFAKKGLTVGAAALVATMSANLSAHTASGAVVASATAGSKAVVPILKGVNAMLWWTSLKPIAAIIVATLILGAGGIAVLLQVSPAKSAAALPATAPTTAQAFAPAVEDVRFGRLLTEDDKPIAGAKVWQIQWSTTRQRRISIASTTSDANGVFQFPATGEETRVLVQAPGYAFSGGSLRSPFKEFPTEIHPMSPGKLRLRFLDPDGKPATGLRVRLAGCGATRTGWEESLSPTELDSALIQTSDPQGVCIFAGVPRGGAAWVEVSDERYAQLRSMDRFEVKDDDVTDAGDVHLKPAASISGKVMFEDGSPALAGINITADSELAPPAPSTMTDEQGHYQLKQLSRGKYWVFIYPSDELWQHYAAESIGGIEVFPGMHLEGQNLRLIIGGIVRGRITEKATGKPLAEVALDVPICGPSRRAGMFYDMEVTSNANGEYSFHVPPGSNWISLARQLNPTMQWEFSGDPPHGFTVLNNHTVEQNLELRRTGAVLLKGRAVDQEGHPMPGVEIYTELTRNFSDPVPGRIVGLTDLNGKFSIPSIAPKTRLRGRRGQWTTVKPVSAGGAGSSATLVLQKDVWASVRGVVRHSDGKPFAGARVMLQGGPNMTTTTGPDGSYVFNRLYPDISYSISTTANGFGFLESDIKIQPGKETDLPAFILAKADSFVAGTVLDENGNAVAEAHIHTDLGKYMSKGVKTDIAGHFWMDELVPGVPITLRVDNGERSLGTLDNVIPGTDNLVITVHSPTTQPGE